MQKHHTGRYRYIHGEFVIRYADLPRNGPEPDGDTIAFRPTHAEDIRSLPLNGGIPAKFNMRGMVSIRFLDIDALETRFQGTHQNLAFANAARDHLLTALGFSNVAFYPDQPNQIESAESDTMPGFILALGTDVYGRVLADVFAAGVQPNCIKGKSSGDRVFVETRDLDNSVNKSLLDAGLAYAELYTTTPIQIARHMANAAKAAREFQLGLWAEEAMNAHQWATLVDLAALETLVLFPKLFRRLVAFFAEGNSALRDFDAWLRREPLSRDDRLLLPMGEIGNMHDLFVVEGHRMRMTCNPEDVVFLPDRV
jgi:endonuclease YncB( thermonuclease family)